MKPMNVKDITTTSSEKPWNWMPPSLIVVLTFNVILGVYQSINNPSMIVFLAFNYSDLILFFLALQKFEEAKENPGRRKKLLVAIWVLPTALVCMHAYLVTSIMPFALKVLLWSTAGLCICCTFYVCFLLRGEVNNEKDKVGGYVSESDVCKGDDCVKIAIA